MSVIKRYLMVRIMPTIMQNHNRTPTYLQIQIDKAVKDFMVLVNTIVTKFKSAKLSKVKPMSLDKIFSNIN